MKKIYICGILFLMGMVACSSDKDSEEGYTMNDIIGKWEGYKWLEVSKNPNTGELNVKREITMLTIDGRDSTWIEVYYDNGSLGYGYEGSDEYRDKYEVKGNMLIINNGIKFYIDELTHQSMKLRYSYEKPGGLYTQFVYRRIE